MRNFMLAAAAVFAIGLISCSEKDDDDTSTDEVVDTAGEETGL